MVSIKRRAWRGTQLSRVPADGRALIVVARGSNAGGSHECFPVAARLARAGQHRALQLACCTRSRWLGRCRRRRPLLEEPQAPSRWRAALVPAGRRRGDETGRLRQQLWTSQRKVADAGLGSSTSRGPAHRVTRGEGGAGSGRRINNSRVARWAGKHATSSAQGGRRPPERSWTSLGRILTTASVWRRLDWSVGLR